MSALGLTSDFLLDAALSNAVLVSALAMVVEVVARLVRQPAFSHRLWLLLMVKMVTPPLIVVSLAWPWTPRPSSSTTDRPPVSSQVADVHGRSVPVGVVTGGAAAVNTSPLPGPKASPVSQSELATTMRLSFEWGHVLIALWLTGSGIWVLWYVRHFARVRCWLKQAPTAPPSVREMAEGIARTMGLGCPPVVLFVSATVSPAIWALSLRPRLVISRDLWERLSQDQRAALLAHELAHLRRRDHWIRPLEMVVTALYWWFPVIWWVRRSLRESEEQCCDAWVLRTLPGSGKFYARTLLDTIDFLSEGAHRLPILASGMSEMSFLKGRLSRIVSGTTSPSLSRRGAFGLLGLAGLLLPTSFPREFAPKKYHLMDLGSLGGGGTSALAINDRGEVVGSSLDSLEDRHHAFRTRPNRPINAATDFIHVPGLTSTAVAINNRGQVLVSSAIRDPRDDPRFQRRRLHSYDMQGGVIVSFRVDDDRVIAIGALDHRSFPAAEELHAENLRRGRLNEAAESTDGPFVNSTFASDLNDSGVAVGISVDKYLCIAGFRTSANRPVNPARDDFGDLGFRLPYSGAKRTILGQINNVGQVIGTTWGPDGKTHAFRSRPNQPVDLAVDGLVVGAEGPLCDPICINDVGQVAGSIDAGDHVRHAFRTRPNRPIDPIHDDLGTLGGESSSATAINNKGQVVGYSGVAHSSLQPHAFLVDGRRMIDLNDVIPPGSGITLTKAHGINNHGQIVAEAWDSRQVWKARSYLLTPIPDAAPLLIVATSSFFSIAGALFYRTGCTRV